MNDDSFQGLRNGSANASLELMFFVMKLELCCMTHVIIAALKGAAKLLLHNLLFIAQQPFPSSTGCSVLRLAKH